MRLLAALAIVCLCVATAAVAQEAAPEFTPEFDQMPTAGTYEQVFPRRALREGMSGMVVMCCTPRDDRTLDCTTAVEWPRDWGFGDAAEAAARRFRLTEASYAAYIAGPRSRIRRLVWLRTQGNFGMSPGFEEVFDRIRDGTADVCRDPPATG